MSARTVIVYDLPTAQNLVYVVPAGTLLQLVLGKRMAPNDALNQIAADNLPQAFNLDFATEDQLPLLRQVKATATATLYRDCQAAILAGYSSSALGAPHVYPSGVIDQQNMTVSVLASLLPGLAPDWATPFLCQDGDGVWDFRDHTAAQIQQAGSDGKAFILAARVRVAGLAASVAAAPDAETAWAVAW